MKHTYSLVHLTNIACSPPAFIRTAAAAGYDAVSLRTIPMGLPGEVPHDITDRKLRAETLAACQETGVWINDTENARIDDGVDVHRYEPHLEAAAELGIRHVLSNIWTADPGLLYGAVWRALPAGGGLWPGRERGICNLGQRGKSQADGGTAEGGGPAKMWELWWMPSFLPLPRESEGAGGASERVVSVHAPVRYNPGDSRRSGNADSYRKKGTSLSGEGAIDLKAILEKLPEDIVRGIEVPHVQRLEEIGFEEHARRALQSAKQCLE